MYEPFAARAGWCTCLGGWITDSDVTMSVKGSISLNDYFSISNKMIEIYLVQEFKRGKAESALVGGAIFKDFDVVSILKYE